MYVFTLLYYIELYYKTFILYNMFSNLVTTIFKMLLGKFLFYEIYLYNILHIFCK